MITAKGITKSFPGLQVLKGVDLQIDKSEIVSIVGASGAGKTTLLNVLGTLLRPDGGTLEIDGVDPFRLSDRKLSDFRCTSLGFVFQFHHLLPEFTALENVMLPALIAGSTKAKARQRALELLSEVGLSARIDHSPSELSGGESQRVAIARALVNSPSVLLADEPSGNLDSVTREDIHSLFFRLRERFGQTTVIVTHDSALASMCDRSLTMKDGQFV
ncbi:MAG: ABC transporter ATP-binding protein [Bacteroidales bacterium]|nr:ABC transporter ATP-binding protein [Bacteroidales bacterium]